LDANFVWFAGVDAVHASVDPAAGKRERCNLLDVLATKTSSIWPLTSGAARDVHEVSIAVVKIITVVRCVHIA
jgi:hypothetical protein